MSPTTSSILDLTPDVLNLLQSALPHLTEQEMERVRLLTTGSPSPSVIDMIRDDPSRILEMAKKPPDPWQTELLQSDSDRLLLLCSRQAGKSLTAAALGLREALTKENALVLLLSPTLRQSAELFRDKVMRLYSDLGRPVPSVNSKDNALRLELENGSRIISLPGTEETIRGYSGTALLVIDEASRVKDSLYYSVRPMLAVSKGKLIVLSTPWGKQGWFYDAWTGTDVDWTRIEIKASDCPRITQEFLDEERKVLGERWFRQEYECSFEDTIDAVFAQADIEAAMSVDLPPLF